MYICGSADFYFTYFDDLNAKEALFVLPNMRILGLK